VRCGADRPTATQDKSALAQPAGEGVVVGRQDHGPVSHDPSQQAGGVGSETGVRLVEDEKARVVEDRAGDPESLLHASRELARRTVRVFGDANHFERLLDARATHLI
jgi:hypothetical protein